MTPEAIEVLRDVRTLLEAINEKLATGSESRSSVQLESNSKGTNLTVKAYVGSDVSAAGAAALAEFGRVTREIARQQMVGWADTVEQLQAEKAA